PAVTTNTTLHAGHDVRYLTSGNAHGGNAGAMRYYTASGEPPGRWAGKGAVALGLSGTVDGTVMDRLYMEHVGPSGERLTRPRRGSRWTGPRPRPATPGPGTTRRPRGSGGTGPGWSRGCSPITSAETGTRSCTSTSRSRTWCSGRTGPTASTGGWTPGPCITS